MAEVTTNTQLINMLEVSNQRVIDWFSALPDDNFFIRHGDAWSASDNVDHLIRAHKPIVLALKLPRIALRAMFGKPNRASISYEALCQNYRDEIVRGAQASGRYLPAQESPAFNIMTKKKDLLNQFSNVSTELVSVAGTWKERDLDGHLLPHPILGKLTVREILFFTIYHNLRHASQEGD